MKTPICAPAHTVATVNFRSDRQYTIAMIAAARPEAHGQVHDDRDVRERVLDDHERGAPDERAEGQREIRAQSLA